MTRKGQSFALDRDLPWETAGEGVTRKVLTYADAVMLVRVRFEAGAVGPPHSHPHIQCSLVESGVFDVMIAGETRRLGPGDSFLVPPDALHSAVNIEPGTLLDVFTPMREDFVAPP